MVSTPIYFPFISILTPLFPTLSPCLSLLLSIQACVCIHHLNLNLNLNLLSSVSSTLYPSISHSICLPLSHILSPFFCLIISLSLLGDMIPWTISQQFNDNEFATLSGARIVRIATHPGRCAIKHRNNIAYGDQMGISN